VHRAITCACLVLMMAAAASPSPCDFGRRGRQSMPQLEATWEDVIAQVNALRSAGGLEPAEADTAMCLAVSRYIRYAAEKEDVPLTGESAWVEQLDQAVPHYSKRCFYALSDSVQGAVSALVRSRAFLESATYANASHIAVAAGDEPGLGSWCAGCTFRRLVELGRVAFYQTFSEGGFGSTTFCGRAWHPHVRATIAGIGEEAPPDESRGTTQQLELDADGWFAVTIPMSRSTSDYYEVTLYISEDGIDYEPAAKLDIRVPKAMRGSF
jgi:hypothetical protein